MMMMMMMKEKKIAEFAMSRGLLICQHLNVVVRLYTTSCTFIKRRFVNSLKLPLEEEQEEEK